MNPCEMNPSSEMNPSLNEPGQVTNGHRPSAEARDVAPFLVFDRNLL
jgi:hypothetical protein